MTRSSTRARTRELPATGGGVIRRTELPGGLRIVTETMPGVRSASVGVWVPVGSRDETASVSGASHFLEHLLFKGTRSRSALDIARTMDAVGGECNAFTEKEHTCYYATVLDRDLAFAIDLVCDVVLNATVSAADVDVERAVVLEEIAMRDDDPADLVHDEFAGALFGDDPLGRAILGTDDTIHGLSRSQIHGYYRRRYRPSEMVVAVAGSLDHAEVVRQVRRAFADVLDDSAAPDAAQLRPDRTSVRRPARALRVVGEDTEQANIVLGGLGLSRFDQRKWALSVASSAVGGGMSSRLFQQVREQRGLAYSTYSYTSGYAGTGLFALYAGCQPAKADEVVTIMRTLLADVARDGLTPDEVTRAKGQLRGSLVLGLEDSGSRMTRIGKAELSFGEVLGLDQLLARIDEVTVSEVNDVLAEVAAGAACLTVVGPFDENEFATV